MSVPTPPELSREIRLEGHRRSLELRQARAELKRWVASEGPGPMWCVHRLADAVNSHCAQGMKVRTLLMALPYVGPKKADEMLDRAGIPRDNTVRACGPKQRERLFQLLAER